MRGLVLAVLALLALPVLAQDDVIAFGDSITQGTPPFDEEKRGGYPDRLQENLRGAGMDGVKVINEGLSSEKTGEGLSRMDSVLSAHANKAGTIIIMEGTNDVTLAARGKLSLETTMRNLEAMAAKARAQALVAIYATIIPRPDWAKLDRNNNITRDLVFRIREQTSSGSRPLAEPFDVFATEAPPNFKKLYYCCDPVGHPKGAGFDLLAEIFADRILGNDTLAPTISRYTKSGTFAVLKVSDKLQAILHESGTGIRQSETYFTVGGRKVDTTVSGSKRRLELSYKITNRDVGCAGRIAVRTEDSADPPNVRHRVVGEPEVAGASYLRGDVNGDCSVDGFDLALMGRSFGSARGEEAYSRLADTNNDSKIDGDDLAKLSRNFGKNSS